MKPKSMSNYPGFLDKECPLVVAAIRPFGLAMSCGDIQEAMNGFQKVAYNEDS